MHPIPFSERERVLAPLDGQHQEMSGLRVVDVTYADGTSSVVSCWQLTDEEISVIQKTGNIYVAVMGRTQPPIYLSVDRSEFGV
jgi:hypothetical protein